MALDVSRPCDNHEEMICAFAIESTTQPSCAYLHSSLDLLLAPVQPPQTRPHEYTKSVFSGRHRPRIYRDRLARCGKAFASWATKTAEMLLSNIDGKLDRLPVLADELVALKVDVIVTHGTPGSRAAKKATATIPIVIAVIGDPIGNGLVASLSRPGGNITGLVLQEFETTVKWFELLKQVVPQAFRLGLLDVPGIERTETAAAVAAKEDSAARSLGLDIQRVTVREANDLHQTF